MTEEWIEKYLGAMIEGMDRLDRPSVGRVIEALYKGWKEGRTIFIMGNGGSASTATHMAADLNHSVTAPGRKRYRAIALTDNIPWQSALINDEGFDLVFSEQLRNLMSEGDILIAFSVHGGAGRDKAGPWSQNLLRAMSVAREEFKATTIGISGFDGGPMAALADFSIVVPCTSTPHVESLHASLAHLIAACLKERIEGT